MGGASVHLPGCRFASAFREEIRAKSDCPLPFSADCPVGGGGARARAAWAEEGGRLPAERLSSLGGRDWVGGHRGWKGDGAEGSERTAAGS